MQRQLFRFERFFLVAYMTSSRYPKWVKIDCKTTWAYKNLMPSTRAGTAFLIFSQNTQNSTVLRSYMVCNKVETCIIITGNHRNRFIRDERLSRADSRPSCRKRRIFWNTKVDKWDSLFGCHKYSRREAFFVIFLTSIFSKVLLLMGFNYSHILITSRRTWLTNWRGISGCLERLGRWLSWTSTTFLCNEADTLFQCQIVWKHLLLPIKHGLLMSGIFSAQIVKLVTFAMKWYKLSSNPVNSVLSTAARVDVWLK